jgi:hypothetical protein
MGNWVQPTHPKIPLFKERDNTKKTTTSFNRVRLNILHGQRVQPTHPKIPLFKERDSTKKQQPLPLIGRG